MAKGDGELLMKAKAKEMLEEALTIIEKERGPEHPEVVVTLVNLGSMYIELGDPNKAKEVLERALASEEKRGRPKSLHPMVLVIYSI